MQRLSPFRKFLDFEPQPGLVRRTVERFEVLLKWGAISLNEGGEAMEDLEFDPYEEAYHDGSGSVDFSGVAIGFAAGLLVGAGVALLYAPMKGKYLRANLSKKVEDVSGFVRDTAEKTAKSVRSFGKRVGMA